MSYYINTFDDGHEKYNNIVNAWKITSWWKGKVALKNVANPSITIPSISHWKISVIENGYSSDLKLNVSPK